MGVCGCVCVCVCVCVCLYIYIYIYIGFVDKPQGLMGMVGEVGAAAEKVPGVGLLLGGLSSVGTSMGNMVGVTGPSGEGGKLGADPFTPQRPYSTLVKAKSLGVSGAVSVDTDASESRHAAFAPSLEPKMPKAPRGLDMAGVEEEEEEGQEETDETVVAHRYGV